MSTTVCSGDGYTRTPPRWQRKAWPATMRPPGVGCVTAGNRPSGGTSSSDALGAGRHADGPRWSFNTADRPHPPAYHRLRRLACARGDATTRRPAGWDASLPRLRAWGCYLYAACLDRMQGASPARVGMLLPAARCCAVRLRLACARGDATGSSLPPPLHGAGSRAARPAMGGPRRSGQRAGVGGARRLPLTRGALPYTAERC